MGIRRMLEGAAMAVRPCRLDSRSKSLFRGGELVGLSPCEFEVLHLSVRRAHVVPSKGALNRAGWNDTAVGDNSLEKWGARCRSRGICGPPCHGCRQPMVRIPDGVILTDNSGT